MTCLVRSRFPNHAFAMPGVAIAERMAKRILTRGDRNEGWLA